MMCNPSPPPQFGLAYLIKIQINTTALCSIVEINYFNQIELLVIVFQTDTYIVKNWWPMMFLDYGPMTINVFVCMSVMDIYAS